MCICIYSVCMYVCMGVCLCVIALQECAYLCADMCVCCGHMCVLTALPMCVETRHQL